MTDWQTHFEVGGKFGTAVGRPCFSQCKMKNLESFNINTGDIVEHQGNEYGLFCFLADEQLEAILFCLDHPHEKKDEEVFLVVPIESIIKGEGVMDDELLQVATRRAIQILRTTPITSTLDNHPNTASNNPIPSFNSNEEKDKTQTPTTDTVPSNINTQPTVTLNNPPPTENTTNTQDTELMPSTNTLEEDKAKTRKRSRVTVPAQTNTRPKRNASKKKPTEVEDEPVKKKSSRKPKSASKPSKTKDDEENPSLSVIQDTLQLIRNQQKVIEELQQERKHYVEAFRRQEETSRKHGESLQNLSSSIQQLQKQVEQTSIIQANSVQQERPGFMDSRLFNGFPMVFMVQPQQPISSPNSFGDLFYMLNNLPRLNNKF